MKYHWHLGLNENQFKTLQKGLKSYFRFYLNLAVETVTYDYLTGEFTVLIPTPLECPAKKDLNEQISIYINGFVCANEI